MGRALHIYFAIGVANRDNFIRNFDAEAMVRQPHDTNAVDWNVNLTGEACQQRIGLGPAAEEGHVDAAPEMLIDQHANMNAVLKRLCKPQRGIVGGCDHRAHIHCADILDSAVDGGDVRSAE